VVDDGYEVRGGVVRKVYRLGGETVAVREGSAVYAAVGDHLGSVTVLAQGGSIAGATRYLPYGTIRFETGVWPTDRRFTGQRWEASLGLYDYKARFYDPALGRFLQPDPIVPEPGDPRALNRYAYVYNNPLRYTDPSGHWLETLWDIASIAWDIYEVRRDPSLLNIGALVVDVGAAVLPFVPAGVGMVVRGGKAAKAAVEVASHADEVVDAGRVVAEAAAHANEAAEALKAVERVENASDALRGVNPAVIGEVSERGAEQAARGGTYKLIDPVTGEVQYVGRTKDLARRQAEHRRDPLKEQLRFEIDWRTDDYAVQRGREQMLYDQYRPPLNRIRPISPRNPRLQAYLEAAKRFGERMR
jgi:RHS repeat-associated protein